MENVFKNEMEIELAGEKILLRPTFQNLASMESLLGGLPYLAFKYGKGFDVATGKTDQALSVKSMPPMTEVAQIVYLNQAEKKYTLEQVHDLVLGEGIKACASIVLYLVRCTAGNKLAKEPTERQKKSS